NGCEDPEPDGTRPVLLSEFIDQVYLPFQRKKWKASTKGTSENRIQHHVVKGLGPAAVEGYTLNSLQAFLQQKADAGLSFSTVDHLRWDLSSIFEMAIAEKLITVNPTASLYTPKNAKRGETRAMTDTEVAVALGAVEFRERVIMHMAIFAGFRPGEILALQRRHVSANGKKVQVEQRVYRGDIDNPKSHRGTRLVAVPPKTAALLKEWLDSAVETSPDSYIFAGETGQPKWRDSLLEDHIRPKLKPHNLEWVDFQVMRATNASIGHRLKLDPKVTADQRGHGVGVAINEYTKTSVEDRALAAKKLEGAVLGKAKVIRMPRKKAS
ncbi:MAG: tyrosine-type recombinase/integrase, partial [Phycisphaerales bacterium]